MEMGMEMKFQKQDDLKLGESLFANIFTEESGLTAMFMKERA